MITKRYVKVGNRVRFLGLLGGHNTNKCATIVRTIIYGNYVDFHIAWDHDPTIAHYNDESFSYFDEEHSPAPKKYYRRVTEKDFKQGKPVRCRSKRKGGYWKNETGFIDLNGYKKPSIKKFRINWDESGKRKVRPETWSDFTKNFEVVKEKKNKRKRIAPIDRTLPILQAGHLQDRFIRRAK